jgi:hypothetical protein
MRLGTSNRQGMVAQVGTEDKSEVISTFLRFCNSYAGRGGE